MKYLTTKTCDKRVKHSHGDRSRNCFSIYGAISSRNCFSIYGAISSEFRMISDTISGKYAIIGEEN